MVDPVERCRQVRIEYPAPPSRLAAQGVENGLDGVVAATPGPKAIRLWLEACLPLGFESVDHLGLESPVKDHGYPERAPFPVGLRDVRITV